MFIVLLLLNQPLILLPFILSPHSINFLLMLAKKYCNNFNIKFAFLLLKLKTCLQLRVVCTDRSARVWYTNLLVRDVILFLLAKTIRRLSTRVREHFFTDKNSHIFKHLKNSSPCKNLCSESCFRVIDSASIFHNLKIKKALHIMWERPNLNKQLQHYKVSFIFN